MSINRVLISGNLTRDPELRATASGMPVLALGVAVNDRRKNASTGEWEDYANFVDCTMFGTRAESVSRFLAKGSKVAIEGKLRWSQWERDGQKRNKLEVIVDEIEFLTPRGDGGSLPTRASTSASDSDIPPAPEVTIYDEDIPF
ncbi:MAG: single-stranded DNA-binding protein [Coriobacteriales bacterium]|jgi:single-strand DNA-binding protein|nr:single-stranded DNA-binding protein [Coriobacteriales bacterium]